MEQAADDGDADPGGPVCIPETQDCIGGHAGPEVWGRKTGSIPYGADSKRALCNCDMAALFGQAAGAEFVPSRNGKTLVTRKTSTVRLIEKGNYRLLFELRGPRKRGRGLRRQLHVPEHTPRAGCFEPLRWNGERTGGGSGQRAGHGARGTARHGILREIDAEADQYGAFAERDGRPAGDAGSGTCKSLHGRSGNDETRAAASFLLPDRRSGGEAEILESETVPAGVLNPVEPVMISRKLWDGDKIILVSDGVLDAMPGRKRSRLSGISSTGCPTPVCRRRRR